MHILWNIHKICKHPLPHIVTNIFSYNENSKFTLWSNYQVYIIVNSSHQAVCYIPRTCLPYNWKCVLLTTFTHFCPPTYPVLCFCESWFCILFLFFKDFLLEYSCGSDGKASVYNAGDLGSIPGSGRFPGEGNGNPLQYSCL